MLESNCYEFFNTKGQTVLILPQKIWNLQIQCVSETQILQPDESLSQRGWH